MSSELKVESGELVGVSNGRSGYTLLEVLGVLLLIGLILTLVRPELFRTAERNRVRYVGELLHADLRQIRTEAKAGTKVVLNFNANGYGFWIGDTEIKRNYRTDGLQFQLKAENAGENGSELTFYPDGAVPVTEIYWESKHYRGVLKMNQDSPGVEWKYDAK